MGERKVDQDDWGQVIDGVPEGMRHMTAVRLAGRYYGKGMSVAEVRYILTHWNHRNIPPMDHYEMESILKSTEKWEHIRDISLSDEKVKEIEDYLNKQLKKRR